MKADMKEIKAEKIRAVLKQMVHNNEFIDSTKMVQNKI